MIQLPKGRLQMALWFIIGLLCVLFLAIGLPSLRLVSMAISPDNPVSVHAYTPTNRPGTAYWSVGVTGDVNHLPTLMTPES